MQEDGNSSRSVRARSAIGPMPHLAVAALADLGLSTHEIARYFGVPVKDVMSLLQASGGDASSPRSPAGKSPPRMWFP